MVNRRRGSGVTINGDELCSASTPIRCACTASRGGCGFICLNGSVVDRDTLFCLSKASVLLLAQSSLSTLASFLSTGIQATRSPSSCSFLSYMCARCACHSRHRGPLLLVPGLPVQATSGGHVLCPCQCRSQRALPSFPGSSRATGSATRGTGSSSTARSFGPRNSLNALHRSTTTCTSHPTSCVHPGGRRPRIHPGTVGAWN